MDQLHELALFAGIGGGVLGGLLLGWKTVCAVELDRYCAERLMQRQNEGFLPAFPIWDDVRTFNGSNWNGLVDVVSGGFPCQDISSANKSRRGITGPKSNLWFEFARILCEVQPRFALVENVSDTTSRGLDIILSNLADLGANAVWGLLSAERFGAWHRRNRLWILADFNCVWKQQPKGHIKKGGGRTGNRNQKDRGKKRNKGRIDQLAECKQGKALKDAFDVPEGTTKSGFWNVEPGLVRLVPRAPHRMERIRALGNVQIPIMVVGAWQALSRINARSDIEGFDSPG